VAFTQRLIFVLKNENLHCFYCSLCFYSRERERDHCHHSHISRVGKRVSLYAAMLNVVGNDPSTYISILSTV
jgi:hypothetical protein